MHRNPNIECVKYLGLGKSILKLAWICALSDGLQPQTLQLLRLQLREGTLFALALREGEGRPLRKEEDW